MGLPLASMFRVLEILDQVSVGARLVATLGLPFTRKHLLDKMFHFVHTGRCERTKPDQARVV